MFKKGFILLLVCLFSLSCGIGMTYAAETVTASINDAGTELTISGATELVAGTVVTITVAKPDQDIDSAASGATGSLDAAALLIDETTVASSGLFTYTYTLPSDTVSGRYTVCAAVRGEGVVRETTVDYQDTDAAGDAITALNGSTSVEDVLDSYAKDLNVAAGLVYEDATPAEKQYIADYMEDNKETGSWTLGEAETLLIEAVAAVEALDTLKTLDRPSAKTFLEENHETLDISSATYTLYEDLSDAQKEVAVVNLVNNISTVITPDKLDALLSQSVTKALENADNDDDDDDDSSTSSNRGSGGIALGSDAMKPSTGAEVLPVPEDDKPYSDMGAYSWAEEAVTALTDAGIVSGKAERMFYPADNVTREEAVKMIVLGFGLTDSMNVTFEDVPEDAWYREYLGIALQCGVITGMSETEFGVGIPVSRQDLAVMLKRAADYNKMEIYTVREASFVDQAEIAEYAQEAVTAMANAEIINGRDNGYFAPTATATRAEAAQMCFRLFDKLALL